MIRRFLGCAFLFAVAGCNNSQPVTQDISQQSALKASLPYPVLDWKVLTIIADREQKTMSTLFANDAATIAARSDQPYPAGAIIALATWYELDNPHWFGSRVPGDPQQVEFVEFTAGGPKYRAFAAPSFQEHTGTDAPNRIAAITSIKAVPLP